VSRYLLTRRARLDLQQIWNYIAEDDLDAADRVIRELRVAMEGLAEMPGKGHRRSDVRNPRYRFWTAYSYVIGYFADADPVQIIRVVHGRRDFRRLFSDRR
jgi:plasmid stabilization system protein ParE